MSTVVRNSLLASTIARPQGQLIGTDQQFRRYKATIRTESTIGGNIDGGTKQVTYEIGRANSTKARLLAIAGETAVRLQCSYPTSGDLANDFIGLAKKYQNFSASFEFSNLAPIAERIAKGLAAHSIFGDVTAADLRGNNPLVVNALGTHDAPVNSLTDTVFIPRLVNTSITGDVFTVMVNAAAGEGARITTDVLEIDAATRQPIISDPPADAFPRAAVSALRIIGANMAASDQGPLFALAVVRGLHHCLTVVGHTDEGGITRDLLRCGVMPVPFGGIHWAISDYPGLPALSTTHARDVAVYVDTLALTSAALVAHCDPGVRYDGNWYPAIYQGTSGDDDELRPGGNQEGTDAMAGRIAGQIKSTCSKFWNTYIPGLARLFAIEGNPDTATRFAIGSSAFLANNCRHLRYPTVAPWFWIEPTSLLPCDLLGTEAEMYGSGAYATPNVERVKQAWEDIVPAGEGDVTFSSYYARVRNPRSAWFFAHWLNHPQNGLGAITIRQVDPNLIVQPGACTAHPDVRDRVEHGLPWTDYLWTRGQSPFPAPGELLNLGANYGIMVKHMSLDEDAIPTPEHVPSSKEFLSTGVSILVGKPVGIQTGASNAPDSNARRARTRASRELAATIARVCVYGTSRVNEMPIATTTPSMGKTTRLNEEYGGENGPNRLSFTSPRGGLGGSEGPRAADGDPVPAVPQYQPVRAPQLARGGGAGGLGAPAPPAVPAEAAPPAPGDNIPPPPVDIVGAAPPANGPAENE